jgi:hypothetical protein
MSAWIAAGVVGVTGLASAYIGSEAAKNAAKTQSDAAGEGIDETRRQFDAMQKLLDPYVQAGGKSLTVQGDLAGLNGPEAQRAAIEGISGGPEMAALTAQGENAILQNASATGGVRGGNTQGALAQFRPQMLSSLINQQYGRLSGLTQMGQASAAGVGAAGMQSGAQVADLLGQQGAAVAGGQLAQGQAWAQPLNQFGNLAGLYGMGKMGAF